MNSASTVELAKEIDGLMPQRHYAKSPYKRKYIPTVASLENLKQWFRACIRSLEAAMREMDEEEKKTDVEWTFIEAGFGVSGSDHGSNHVWHDGTNYLFGLVTACMLHPRPQDFRIRTFVIFHVVRPEHADPCEVLGSLCGGTYGRKGWEAFGMHGLNPSLAGGAVLNAPHKGKESDRAIHLPRYDETWGYNCRKAVEAFETTFEKSRKVDETRVSLWRKELNGAAASLRLGPGISAPASMLESAKEEQRVTEEREAGEPGPKRHPGLLAKMMEKYGREHLSMGPPARPLHILLSSSPIPEVNDGQEEICEKFLRAEEGAELLDPALDGAQDVWPSIESDATEGSVVGDEVVPESIWVGQARRGAREKSTLSQITVGSLPQRSRTRE